MKYINKYEIIEAVQWTGDNYDEICNFIGEKLERDSSELINNEPACLVINVPVEELNIMTIELLYVGDYICKLRNEYYPYKRKSFELKYRPFVDNQPEQIITLMEAIMHCKEKIDCTQCGKEHEQLAKWLRELQYYKILNSEHRLKILPCPEGSTVYEVYKFDNKFWDIDEHKLCLEDIPKFGETVFKTLEQATEAKESYERYNTLKANLGLNIDYDII